ncbi:hypothetical protein LRAMOSA01799 [Lichtheimia ramosa]|uniref:MARVEL domain-containing protein n=1 Tax=Lichtheimia ramosa TaxID=688394 RepID=A0A077WKC6_9FUNG|nr:hypothetical protein LRAMOSA01799 [Lichtheimia ramosa]
MTGNNPFEENNPWSNSSKAAPTGPRFGNAYEDDNNAWNGGPVNHMPSPSDYRSSASNNGWSESTKIEYPASESNPSPIATPANAYQYSGTRFGNQDTFGGDAYSKVQVNDGSTPSPAPTPAGGKPRPNQEQLQEALPPKWDDARMNPSKRRLLLRGGQLIAAIGHLGFAAGASPFSNHDFPLDTPACFYFLYAVAIITIIWTFFHLFFYCYRRIAHGHKLNRVLMTGIDLLLAILWGIGTIVEIAKFPCPPGGYDKWCDFYNVSIFWGMLSLVLFLMAVGWDVIGSCIARRK